MKRRKNAYARPDARSRDARAAGYPARSVFKLEELDRRCQLLRAGQRVLDLGAAPGSWSLYAAGRVGKRGRVVAVDLQEMKQELGENVTPVQADVLEAGELEASAAILEHAPYDVVLSDMAPKTTGSRVADQARSFDLFMRAAEIAAALGARGSSFAGKLFMSGDFEAARAAVRERYERARVIKPAGTRPQSTEIYLVGLGLREPGL